jgi:hypothetical protein
VSDANITQIPAPRVPIVDPRTGYVSREWFRFFNNIYVVTGGNTQGVIPINSGGTGATSASQARANLQAGTVSRVQGVGTINGISLIGNVTTEGFLNLVGNLSNISLNTQTIGTIDIDTRTTGVLSVNRGGTGVACAGIRTATADFTVANADLYIINNKSGSTCVVTLPAASDWPGRAIHFKNTQAQALESIANNVVPITGGAAGDAILGATSGAWATVVSDGTNWVIMAEG